MRLPLGATARGHLRPPAELPVVRRIPLQQRLVLHRRQMNVANPETHRGLRNAKALSDLSDRCTLYTS
jgi:hypothetical protein